MYFRIFDKYDSHMDIINYYMTIIKLEQVGIELNNDKEVEEEQQIISKKEIDLLTSIVPYSRIIAKQMMGIIDHSFEIIKNSINNENEIKRIIDSFDEETRTILTKIIGTDIDETTNNIINEIRNSVAHVNYEFTYRIPDEPQKLKEKLEEEKRFWNDRKREYNGRNEYNNENDADEEIRRVENEINKLENEIKSNLTEEDIFVLITKFNRSSN